MTEITRLLELPKHSFFLFGPRGVGKSTWLKSTLTADFELNLLKQDEYLNYLRNPSLLRKKVSLLKPGQWVWIDEVQKVPALLDEVHYLMEEKKIKFALSGSSARKLKRQGTNLLAGRAITKYLDTFSYAEIPTNYDLSFHLQYGSLPLVFVNPDIAKDILRTYITTYLKEEIQEEGHVRKIEPFVRFLEVAAILNGMQVNGNNIAKEAQISRPSIEGYFSILVDTLLGHWLPSYQPKLKVKEQAHPKFYWFDPGVARAAASLSDEPIDSDWLGRGLETIVFNELRIRNHLSSQDRKFSYYRTQSGSEIDFIIELRKGSISKKANVILLEVKNSKKFDSKWLKAMLEFKSQGKILVEEMFLLYRGEDKMQVNGVQILPVEIFFSELHSGKIF